MDVAFIDEKVKFIIIYLNDLTFFSKYDQDHLKHLQQVFENCRKYGLSLNPRKSYYSMTKENILGHIISKQGIKIDPSRIHAIQNITLCRHKKET